jgi:microcystin-dependent protein
MSDQFVGEVRVFGCNFAPIGWALCNGQILSISQNTALFSLLGPNYGGDGKSNFGLPNMQGNIPISQGQGAGLSPYFIGQNGGSQDVTLSFSEMPQHNHNLMTDPDDAPPNAGTPANNALCTSATTLMFTTATSPLLQMNAQMLKPMGGDGPHKNMMPFLTLNFCIALQGIFPSRG